MTLSDMPTKNGAEPIRGEKVRRLSCSERGFEVARCQSKDGGKENETAF